jgi:large subunit ribosomal protein L17
MALVEASKIYRKHLNPFVQYFELSRTTQRSRVVRSHRKATRPRSAARLEELLSKPVDILDLSVRSKNCLDSENITTLRDLVVELRVGHAQGPQLRQDLPQGGQDEAVRTWACRSVWRWPCAERTSNEASEVITMRHRIAGRKLGRNPWHRKATMRNLVAALFEHERITTTVEKAKHYRKDAEKLITLAKEKNLHNVRRAQSILQNKTIVKKLFDEIGPRFKDRPGGYTRVHPPPEPSPRRQRQPVHFRARRQRRPRAPDGGRGCRGDGGDARPRELSAPSRLRKRGLAARRNTRSLHRSPTCDARRASCVSA